MATKYMKLELIGAGTFGRAWLVQHTGSGRQYVVKEVAVTGMTDKERDQALTEVSVLARCKHLNVIRYREAFVARSMLNIVMEYANGGDLQKKIKDQKGTLFAGEVILDWFIQICFALQYIHRQNILHRDMKTQNIFLGKDNIVKVGDFGIARILQDAEDHAVTAIGTPFYLSPEICQRKPYNQKSDMWAAGCILYELCSLHHPFDAPNFTSLVMLILQGQFKPIPSCHGPVLADLVQVLLRVEADGRPTAEQLLRIPALQPTVQAYIQHSTSIKQTPQTPATPVAPANTPVATPGGTKIGTPLPPGGGALKFGGVGQTPVSSTDRSTPKPTSSRKRGTQDSKKIKPEGLNGENKENVDPLHSPLKKFRRNSVRTPDAEVLVENKRIINSADPLRPIKAAVKVPIPKMSLYKDLLMKQKSKEVSAMDDNNSPINCETYTVGLAQIVLSPKTQKRSDSNTNSHDNDQGTAAASFEDVCQMMYSTCNHQGEAAYSAMENLRSFLEDRLGSRALRDTHIKLRLGVTNKLEYSQVLSIIDQASRPYIPLVLQLIQLEFSA